MLAIVFTTPAEASVLKDLAPKARLDDLEEGTPIRVGDALVAVTGAGKIKAALATERLLRARDVDAVVHVGTCVGLDDGPSAGAVVGVSFALEGDRVELEAPTYPRMPLECPFDVDVEGTLVSQDHAPEDADELGYWERLADVRDATGYPVAYVAAQHGTPCHIAKAVAPAAEADGTGRRHDDLAPMGVVLERLLENGLPVA
ncbi:MAG: 5'-methylthioadenosine nucleosidase [Salinibacter sp.]